MKRLKICKCEKELSELQNNKIRNFLANFEIWKFVIFFKLEIDTALRVWTMKICNFNWKWGGRISVLWFSYFER